MTHSSPSNRRLVALLAGAGTMHFLAPRPFDEVIPSRLPGRPRTWTHLSGLAELACAAAVAHPRTRRAGALAAAGLFVAVFPANVKMARDWRDRPPAQRTVAYARLPLQVPLVLWALKTARDSGGSA
ncbi:DoxX family protein [Spirillospora sp. NPDC047279]|uniref:DoxX family protein n=1 Tax=Spirillospora sp. NPDC047279 TaxID=3155478 RepID=UPI0033C9A959